MSRSYWLKTGQEQNKRNWETAVGDPLFLSCILSQGPSEPSEVTATITPVATNDLANSDFVLCKYKGSLEG